MPPASAAAAVTAYDVWCAARYCSPAKAPTNAASTTDIPMNRRWKAFRDISPLWRLRVRRVGRAGRRADRIADREHRHRHAHDEERQRQQQRAVDPLLLVAEMHEDRRHHRSLDRGDDQRDGDR